MTNKQSIARLILYVLATMATSASAGITVVDFNNKQQLVGFIISVLSTGLVTARSYIDQSPNQVIS